MHTSPSVSFYFHYHFYFKSDHDTSEFVVPLRFDIFFYKCFVCEFLWSVHDLQITTWPWKIMTLWSQLTRDHAWSDNGLSWSGMLSWLVIKIIIGHEIMFKPSDDLMIVSRGHRWSWKYHEKSRKNINDHHFIVFGDNQIKIYWCFNNDHDLSHDQLMALIW